jgi:flagellar hook assembly protein FlgD
VNEHNAAAREFALMQNYPNPFNPSTMISYTIPSQANVRLKIFNLLGQEVATLVDAPQPGGLHNIPWNGNGDNGYAVSSGVYVYRLEAKTADGKILNSLKKLVLVK